MNPRFVIATKNTHKVLEFRRILKPLGIDAVSQAEMEIDIDVPEDAGTFEGNSLQKAAAVCKASGLPAIADDSGLEVFALDMRPGVYSARYGGPGLTDVERYEKVLDEMKGVPDEARNARFVSAISVAFSSGKHYCFTEYCDGFIGKLPRGGHGFGYDPIFYVNNRSFAELSDKEKDLISHRGKALRKLAERLPSIINECNVNCFTDETRGE